MITTFIGCSTIDIIHDINNFPKENTKITSSNFLITPGGPALNASIIFSTLGGKSILYTAIGKNNFTKLIKNDLAKHDVQLFDFSENIKNILPVSSIIISKNGTRTIFTSDVTSDLDQKYDELETFIKQSNSILIDGTYPKLSALASTIAKNNNIIVIFDGDIYSDNVSSYLKNVDIAILSEEFYLKIIDIYGNLSFFLKKHNISMSAVTFGSNPIIYYNYGNFGEIPIDDVHVKDTLGAGDFFHGAFCYFFSISKDFLLSLKNASKIASLSCTDFGTRSWIDKLK